MSKPSAEAGRMVVIVDDHPIFRRGLREVVAAAPGFCVTGEAADGLAAVEQIRSLKPDLALLDIDLPGLGGLQVARAVGAFTRVIMLTLHAEENMFNAAMDAGARGYVLKENAIQDVVLALNAVAGGGMYMSHSISQYLIRRDQRVSALREKKTGLNRLTPTERCVLRLVAENKTNKQIAADLFISHRTVEAHRAHIIAKLELHGSRSLLQFAFEHKSALLAGDTLPSGSQ